MINYHYFPLAESFWTHLMVNLPYMPYFLLMNQGKYVLLETHSLDVITCGSSEGWEVLTAQHQDVICSKQVAEL